MDPINIVVVERDADWTQWDSASHLIGHALLVLVQQADESTAAFRARIQARLARLKQSLGSLVLLRGQSRTELSVDALVSGLANLGRGPQDVRTYSRYMPRDFSGVPAHA